MEHAIVKLIIIGMFSLFSLGVSSQEVKSLLADSSDFGAPAAATFITPLVGNPIHAGTGNKFQTETDLSSSSPNGIRFVRYYNSFDERVGVLGSNWRHNYERRVEVATDRSTASVIRGDGKTFTYTPSGTSWVTDPDVTATLTETSTGWIYRMTSGTVEEFDVNGRLVSITDAQGRTQSLSYDAAGNLTSVIDAYGRVLSFTYDAQNRIAQMVTPDGNIQFGYDANNNLVRVTYPDTTTRQYLYENTSFAHALTGIIDENNNRYATWSYDAQGRATSSEHAGGADRVTLVYNTDGTTTVTEANGQVRTFHFTTLHGVMKVTQIDGGPCTSCSGTSRLANYDANGFMSSKTDQNGNVTNYVNNARGLQTSRTEAVGTPEERTITTEWHANYSLPTRITEPGKVTDFAYDANGNLLSRTETDSTSGASRTIAYTYSSLGQILNSNSPRTDVNDVTTFAYDAEGNLTTVTNALGHITRITAHDASGRPLSLTDPNGLVTTLAYDARGRVTSRDVGGEVTSFTYDAAGNITRVTLADGSYLDYNYDAAQRLTGIADQLGNRIDYQLDAAGNRTAESVFDSSGTLVRDRAHVYNELNQLVQSVGAANQTTTYAYDANGNRISTTDANTNPTNSAFDALNRLTAVTDATNGIAQYSYDDQDNLTAVIDPNGNTTTYVYDGLGNLLSQTSPDTGTTTFMHDEAGNVISQTDAKGQTTTYQYDALNRVVQASYADGETFTYVYDTAVNGIGRLASVADANGINRWNYDPQGRVIEQVSEIMGSPYTTQYYYDPTGRLAGVRYPSGLQVDYAYTNGQLTEVMLNTQPLLTNISYDAFGGVKAWTWGNGLAHTRSYDLDGQLIAHSLGGDNRSVSYDAVGNITSLTDAQIAQIFNYDALNRLTAANDTSLEQTFAYDPNSNRTSLITPSESVDYAYAVDSNLLQSITGNTAVNYQYDANGNTVNDGTHSYAFDARNRLISIDGNAAYYHYNALGQRVFKTVAENESRFIYDLNGQLIAETENSGRVKREYIHVNGQVVAMYELGDVLPVDTVYDNTGNNISFNGAWISSTSVIGYEGTDYQHHAPNGLATAHTIIDNGSAEFSVTGTWPSSISVVGFEGGDYQHHYANGPSPEAQTADNDSGSAAGTWPTSTSVAGFEGANYQHHTAGTGSNTFTWSAGVAATGTYEVYARWTAHANRASNATYTINHVGGSTPVTVSQQTNGGSWNLLGSFELDANSTVVLSDAANGYVIADAIQVAPQNAAPNTATWQISAAYGGEFKVYAKWTAHANRASNATYTVHHAAGTTPVTVNQQTNGGEWNLLGSFILDNNSKVTLNDDANGYVIADAIAYAPATALPNLVAWTPNLPGSGQYQVYAKWTAHANRASNATYTVEHVGGNTPVTVNQQTNGGVWNLLGTFTLDSSSRVVLTDQADGYVIADAIRIVSTEAITNDPKVYYVHSDHLGTPRVITDSADSNNTPIWSWNSDPFGALVANEDPDGDGNALTFNLRFPGQYYDSESGLHYNYFRYYDPRTGRYITSDPIGLDGGLNTYGYVYTNPTRYIDPYGLESIIDNSISPGPDGHVNIGVSAGGWWQPGPTGINPESGVAFDTSGGFCLFTRTCYNAATGMGAGGVLGVSASIGNGPVCSGTYRTVSVGGAGFFGLGGGTFVEGNTNSISLARAMFGLAGEMAYAGGMICEYNFFMCFNESDECNSCQ